MKKTSFVLLILALGLGACGAKNTPEEASPPTPANAPSTTQNNSEIQPISTTTNSPGAPEQPRSYAIVDTDQGNCYETGAQTNCPSEESAFFGQDAQYQGNQPRYTDNGDGTVTDNVTGLIWQQDPGEKMTYAEAVAGAANLTLAGYADWRLPTVKELYSLIQFDGLDPSGPNATTLIPFIDTDYFAFEYGDESAGERLIDSQWATSSIYTGTVFGGQQAMFGVNFADGRIKGYPTNAGPGGAKTYFVIYVRGNTSYGENDFVDNGNGTITDNATGLVWMQNDSGYGMNWEEALNYCESLETVGGDWRLPNAKELQSIVDYSRSPDATNSAAIDPIFNTTSIINEAGQADYPYFWSSTTHANQISGGNAVYISFGRALGYMNGQWMDVHGAGAQRSDPKTGSADDYPTGNGPQGDAIRIENYVRCVSDGSTSLNTGGSPSESPMMGGQDAQGQQAQGNQPPQGQDAQGQQGQGNQPPQGQPTQGRDNANGQGRPEIDFAAAAAKLGVTEEALRSALGPPPPDFDAAAAELGVSVEALIEALGIPLGAPPS